MSQLNFLTKIQRRLMFVYTIIIIYIKLMIPYKLFNLFLVGYYLEVKMTSL